MQVLLIRHGATPGNALRQYIGSSDEPLSAEGRRVLCPCTLTGAAYVVTSGMQRSEQTADAVFPGLPHHIEQQLHEMDFGAFEGRSADDMIDDASYRSWVDTNCEGPIPGGECLADFYDRTCAALKRVIHKAFKEEIAFLPIVAHGGTLMCVMQRYLQPEMGFFDYFPKNGEGLLIHVSRSENENFDFKLVKRISFTQ